MRRDHSRYKMRACFFSSFRNYLSNEEFCHYECSRLFNTNNINQSYFLEIWFMRQFSVIYVRLINECAYKMSVK